MRSSSITGAFGLAALIVGFALGGCISENCDPPEGADFSVRAATYSGDVNEAEDALYLGDYIVNETATPHLQVQVDPTAETFVVSFDSAGRALEMRFAITGTMSPWYY